MRPALVRLDSVMDGFALQMKANAGALELESASKRTRDALRQRAARGWVAGGRTFGYRNSDVVRGLDTSGRPIRSHVVRVIEPAEAATVRRIFELSRDGAGIKAIAKMLNADHAPCPRSQQGRPKSWAPSSVCAVLHRPLYRGEIIWGQTLAFPGDLHRLADEHAFRAFLRSLFRQRWVVYAKPPFGGPAHVLQYLARYTHRVAISNHRIVNVENDAVTFRWKDYRHGSQVRTLTVSADEFLRRFLLHVLPRGFVRIRFFGFLANRRRTGDLPCCRRALESGPCQTLAIPTVEKTTPPASWPCPRCGGAMIIIDRLTAH